MAHSRDGNPFTLRLAHILPFAVGHPLPDAGVDLGLDHPASHRLPTQAQLLGHRRCGSGH